MIHRFEYPRKQKDGAIVWKESTFNSEIFEQETKKILEQADTQEEALIDDLLWYCERQIEKLKGESFRK